MNGEGPDAFRSFSAFDEAFSRQFQARAENWARYYAGVIAEGEAMLVDEVARRSLRPRLRWAARYPRVMKVLKMVGLWRPPTACYRGGVLIGFTRGDGT